jgi:hypothetical protein
VPELEVVAELLVPELLVPELLVPELLVPELEVMPVLLKPELLVPELEVVAELLVLELVLEVMPELLVLELLVLEVVPEFEALLLARVMGLTARQRRGWRDAERGDGRRDDQHLRFTHNDYSLQTGHCQEAARPRRHLLDRASPVEVMRLNRRPRMRP